jgi:ATP-binding cassette subfamily C protein CydC
MIRNRQSLILGAMLAPREAELLAIDAQSRKAARALDRADRNAGAALSALVAATAALALMVGGWLVARDMAGPAIGAIGVFVALALAETLLPLRRGFSDYGRMIGAARRIGTDTKPQPSGRQEVGLAGTPVLTLCQPGLSIELEAGDAVALTGPSGSGKTSLLMQIAGLADNDGISILGRPPAHWADAELRKVVTMVPQRSALIAGTIRENLSLAGEVEDAGMWRALDAVALGDVIRERGGLDARLNEGGAGLSGGQARRLSLARAVLKSPRLLLLDEPTEGLDADTANRVLWGLRNALPEAAIIATLHRSANHPLFTRQISLQNDEVTNLRLDLQV